MELLIIEIKKLFLIVKKKRLLRKDADICCGCQFVVISNLSINKNNNKKDNFVAGVCIT